jgi:hypothetical protein
MKSIIGYSWLIVTTIVMVAVLAFDLGQAETILLFAYFPVSMLLIFLGTQLSTGRP